MSSSLETIRAAIKQISPEINAAVHQMAKTDSKQILTERFNQACRDLLQFLVPLTQKYGVYEESKIATYKMLYEKVSSIDRSIPVEGFINHVLQYAPHVYDEDIEFFMQLELPTTDVNVKGQFTVLMVDVFKSLAKKASPQEMERVVDILTSMTMTAHASFFQMIGA